MPNMTFISAKQEKWWRNIFSCFKVTLKSAMRALVSRSRLREGKMSSLRGQPLWSIRLSSSPLSVLASRLRANSPNAES